MSRYFCELLYYVRYFPRSFTDFPSPRFFDDTVQNEYRYTMGNPICTGWRGVSTGERIASQTYLRTRVWGAWGCIRLPETRFRSFGNWISSTSAWPLIRLKPMWKAFKNGARLARLILDLTLYHSDILSSVKILLSDNFIFIFAEHLINKTNCIENKWRCHWIFLGLFITGLCKFNQRSNSCFIHEYFILFVSENYISVPIKINSNRGRWYLHKFCSKI